MIRGGLRKITRIGGIFRAAQNFQSPQCVHHCGVNESVSVLAPTSVPGSADGGEPSPTVADPQGTLIAVPGRINAREVTMSQFAVTVLFSGLLCASPVFAQTAVKSWAITNAPEHLRPTISRADLLIIEVQSSHLRQLKRQLAEGGLRWRSACAIWSQPHSRTESRVSGSRRGSRATGFATPGTRQPRGRPHSWPQTPGVGRAMLMASSWILAARSAYFVRWWSSGRARAATDL